MLMVLFSRTFFSPVPLQFVTDSSACMKVQIATRECDNGHDKFGAINKQMHTHVTQLGWSIATANKYSSPKWFLYTKTTTKINDEIKNDVQR